jgi:hypothetical protein
MPVVFMKYMCNRNIMKNLIGSRKGKRTWKNYVQMENRIKINNTEIVSECVDLGSLAQSSVYQRGS